jgi:hypothetical protein
MAYTFNPFTGTFDNAPSTLKGDSAYSTLCAISGDLVNYEYLHEGFLPLSGGTLTGSLSSLSSIYVDGEFQAGSGSIATLYISGTAVGVNTETPNKELTVAGDVSATGVVYADGGNSVLWNDVYTSYSTASSTFLTSETDSQTLSFDETTKDLSISNGNTVSLSALVDASAIDTGVRELTANWESTYNTVSALSAEWSAADEVMVAQVTNADSVTLNRGDVVYTFGATGDVMSVKLASNSSETTSSKTLGVINETIIPNGIGYATVAGRITKMSFPAPFVEGDALWLGSTPGTFTRVKPVAPEHGVYLGVVERANNGNGIAYIKVQNGYELNEIHDVLITSPQAKDLLQRNSSNTLWVNGPLSADASNITSGTIDAARMPAFSGDITTIAGTTSATVVAIQGEPISTQTPSTGQILQWSGTSWTPGSLPTGGSGGGGLSYYFNFGVEAQSPTTNLSATPNTPKELGTIGTILSSSYTTGNLSQTSYDLVCGFVSLTGNPNTTVIPSGLWDFNIWASSTGTVTNQTMLRLFVYKYDGVNIPTLLAESDDIYLYDPSVTGQYIASVVFPQTNILITDRIYIEIRAKATQNNRTVTVYFGNGTPSHLHTTLPSVGGTGLVKVIDGVYQTPASLLVDADVASNANIAQSKINGLTDLANKADSTYTTLNSTSANNASVYSSVASTSANWNSTYSTVQTNSATTWNYQGTDLKNLSANWESTYSTVSSLSSGWLTTNYLSTNNVLLSGLTVTTTISAKDKIYVNEKQVVTTDVTSVPGTSAVTTIIAVSALPGTQIPGTLYILV